VSKIYGCPVEFALDMIGGKWKTVIVARLKQGPMRYGELRRAIPNLSDKVLTERLRDLETRGLVIHSGDARYALTERGLLLAPALQALYDWGTAIAPTIGARIAL
jgi:DNA-binding HxlR family transcriptional regulator